ncbi:MAG: hypothetical protein DRR42_08890 [Gammaproteobacteria bacterium]|nr:MAG: hypothetical protein DRR42_08890 [Gammaproteobacteria bacterium]
MFDSIKRGTEIILDGIQYEVDRVKSTARRFVLIADEGAVQCELTFEQFSVKLARGVLKVIGDGESHGQCRNRVPGYLEHLVEESSEITKIPINEEQKAEIAYKKGYVESISDDTNHMVRGTRKQRYLIDNHAAEIRDDAQPSLSTVRRWFNRLKAQLGNLFSLLRKRHLPADQFNMTDADRECAQLEQKLFEHVLKKYFLRKTKMSVPAMRLKMVREVEESTQFRGCNVPHVATLYRKIAALPDFEKIRKQKGWREAKRQFPTGFTVEEPTYLLEWVELDHTKLDIIVVDDVTGEPIGRPWFTAFIDKKSRMILGFYIAMHAPNVKSVLRAFRNAVLDKEYVKETYGDFIVNDWPCMGLMDQICTDNGADLTADQTQSVLSGFCDVIYNPPGEPQLKGVIERFNRTMNEGLFHGLRGTTFSNYNKKGEYPSEAEAVWTLEAVTKIVHKWIIDEYHITPHRTLRMSPLEAWKDELHNMHELRMPRMDEMNQMMWKEETRSIQKDGISIHNLRYQSPELMDIAKQHGVRKRVDLLVDEDDLGSIRVLIPGTNNAITVPCRQSSYVKKVLSLKEHQRTWNQTTAKLKKGEKAVESQLIASRHLIEQLQEAERLSRNKAKRRISAILKASNSDKYTNTAVETIGITVSGEASCPDIPDEDFDHIKSLEVSNV